MANAYLSAQDLRSNPNYMDAVVGAIGSRIKKSSDMAARERAYASKQAEKGGTSLEEAGIGRGYFFKRALGSSFGGDRIARTRGRFETDPGPGRDPSGTQASRFRGGFDYGVNNTIKSPTGGALANIAKPGGATGGIAGFLEAGAQAVNPEVLGGELAKYQGTRKNAAGFTVNTTATEVKDLAGILNQIGQLIVQTSNSTITAIDGVQRVNVRVVESVQSLGQLQASIAERAMQQQRMLAGAAEDHQEKMLSRQISAAEAGNFTADDFSGNLTAEKGYGFGGKGGGILGGLFGGSPIGDMLGLASDFMGVKRSARSRTNRFGVQVRGGAGDGGFNFRYKNGEFQSGTGNSLNRIRGESGKGWNLNKADNDIMKRYARRYGEGAAVKRFGADRLGDAGMQLGKSRMLSRFLRPIFKRIPIFGGLIDFAVSLALGEPVGRAAAKAVGATLGAGLGSLIPVPGVGTIAGGILGDFAGGAIYDAVAGGGGGSTEGVTPFASGGIVTRPTTGLVGEAGAEGVFPLEGKKGRDTFVKFGEGILEAQRRNRNKFVKLQAAGLEQYYEKENGWTKGWKKFTDWIKSLGGALAGWIFGNGDPTAENPYGRSPNEGLFNRRSRGLSGNAFSGAAADANPILESFLPTAQGGRPATLTPGNDGSTTNFGENRGNRRHEGVDIGTDVGQKVLAIEEGTVVDAYPTGYGKHGGAVVVEHADKTRYVYGHITPSVKKGDTLKPGDHLGNVVYYPGPNGADYTHLHLERINAQNKKIDAIGNLIGQENLSQETKRAEEASNITPQQVIPLPAGLSVDPVGASRPAGELPEKIMSARSSLLNTMRKFSDQWKNVAPFISRGGKSKGEKLSVPGVGSIVKDRGLIGDWFNKYFNASGKQISEQEFTDLITKQNEKNVQQLKRYNEALGLDSLDTTADPWASANADTGNGVLQASATVAAGDRALASAPAIITMPMESKSGGNNSQTMMPTSLAGTPASSMTPGWVLNSVLT